jgi:hypothetical protein
VAEVKSTVNWQDGYDATWRGQVLKSQKKGLAEE